MFWIQFWLLHNRFSDLNRFLFPFTETSMKLPLSLESPNFRTGPLSTFSHPEMQGHQQGGPAQGKAGRQGHNKETTWLERLCLIPLIMLTQQTISLNMPSPSSLVPHVLEVTLASKKKKKEERKFTKEWGLAKNLKTSSLKPQVEGVFFLIENIMLKNDSTQSSSPANLFIYVLPRRETVYSLLSEMPPR